MGSCMSMIVAHYNDAKIMKINGAGMSAGPDRPRAQLGLRGGLPLKGDRGAAMSQKVGVGTWCKWLGVQSSNRFVSSMRNC